MYQKPLQKSIPFIYFYKTEIVVMRKYYTLQDCPKGHHCPTSDASPIPCKNGYYTDTVKQTYCLPCPEGHQCLGASEKPTPCESGKYSEAGNTTCLLCPAGYECPNGKFIS